jgi:hypothetical protein
MSQGPIDEPALTPGEREVERALAGLTPAAAGMSREEMLFEAGRASAAGTRRRGSPWMWQVGCLALACVAAWGVLRPARVVENTVVVERPAAVEKNQTAAVVRPAVAGDAAAPAVAMYAAFPQGSYLQMRNEVLTRGVSAVKVDRGGGEAEAGSSGGSKPAWQLRQAMGGAW